MKSPIHQGSIIRKLYRHYHRWLPQSAVKTTAKTEKSSFFQVASRYDALFLDAYGVLYGGSLTQSDLGPRIGENLYRLRQQGVHLRLLSNNGHESVATIVEKLQQLGIVLKPQEIITSGMVAAPFIRATALHDHAYHLIGSAQTREAYAPDPQRLIWQPDHPQPARYILACSDSIYYGSESQKWVEESLAEAPLPLLVVNPDMVVPRPDGSWFPVAGYTALDLHQRYGAPFIGIGKPFSPIFRYALQSLPAMTNPRLLMVGDTLETDILGANLCGMDSCLTLSGTMASMDRSWPDYCAEQGVWPDWVVEHIAD
uniref:Putative haloacid dehalogenase domain protein hydrolase n=1 Tax=Magnetococcus massalia (strain MO-1) TaxID=451514 RepID=A0A1S7LLA2_MAGMO|nr:putative haloacid dehalogenase domain protein hydrolase [Candidatus Magnetococcus massalia]